MITSCKPIKMMGKNDYHHRGLHIIMGPTTTIWAYALWFQRDLVSHGGHAPPVGHTDPFEHAAPFGLAPKGLGFHGWLGLVSHGGYTLNEAYGLSWADWSLTGGCAPIKAYSLTWGSYTPIGPTAQHRCWGASFHLQRKDAPPSMACGPTQYSQIGCFPVGIS